MTFNSGEEMLRTIQDGIDLYNAKENLYVFLYNSAGSIAYYVIDEEKANELRQLSADYGDYWSVYLGAGGYIADDPTYECYEEGQETNLDWCNENYQGEWEDVS